MKLTMSYHAKILLLLLFIIHANGSDAQPLILQKVTAYMDAQAKVNQFAGTVLIAHKGSIFFQKAYGNADYEWKTPNTINTKFGIASITKQFTAIAILQLAERGKLKLTDNLLAFFPEFPQGDQINIHMLLTHTSGLALDFEELYLDRTTLTRDSALTYIKSLPLEFKPGTKLAYSNVGYFLLAEIISKVAGVSYADFLQQNIFDVLNMKDSGLNSNEEISTDWLELITETEINSLKILTSTGMSTSVLMACMQPPPIYIDLIGLFTPMCCCLQKARH